MAHAAADGATVYTDEATAYNALANREAVKHGVGEYVKRRAGINGIESFWSMLKLAHVGTFHKLSPKHLNRYVREFAEKQNMRNSDTLAQMRRTVLGLVGCDLPYRNLVADNGFSSAARRPEGLHATKQGAGECLRGRACQVALRVEHRLHGLRSPLAASVRGVPVVTRARFWCSLLLRRG